APTAVGTIGDQTNQDGATITTLDVRGFFADLDTSDTLDFTSSSLPPGLSINASGEISGTLASNASVGGPYTVTITASDGTGSVDQQFTWTVTNPGPNAVSDGYSTAEDTDVSGDVSSNDSDIDGDALSYSLINGPSNGTLSFNADGTFTYTPNANYNGLDGFRYEVCDADGAKQQANVNVSIGAVNDPPRVSTPLADLTHDDGDSIFVDLSSNFSDAENDTLSFSATGLPPGIRLSTAGLLNGNLPYNASQSGPYTVEVFVEDGNGGAVSDTFVWQVQNKTPIAGDDAGSVNEDASYWGDVSANDNDPDGDPTTFAKLTDPSNGSVVFFSNGRYQYTPKTDFNGSDLFTYEIRDGDGAATVATVHVTVKPINDAPQSVAFLGDQTSQDADSVLFDVASYFADVDGDALMIEAFGLPPGLSIDNAGVISGTIARDASIHGPYDVEVVVKDGQGGTLSVEIQWAVTNPSPIAADDQATTGENDPITGNLITDLLGQDNDPDGDSLQIQLVNGTPVVGQAIAGSAGGQFVIQSDGSYSFDPGTDFDGLAVGEQVKTKVGYTVSDSQGGLSSAELEILVEGRNDRPISYSQLADRENVEGDSASADMGKWFGDPDGDPKIFVVSGLPPGLTVDSVTGLISGTLPDGASRVEPYEVTVVVTDPHGESVTRSFHWRVTPKFAFDSFNNASDWGLSGRITERSEVLLSSQIETLAPEPLLAGSAKPGTILVARIYAEDGSVLGEVKTQANQAGNWTIQFFGVGATQNTRIIVEHTETENVVLGESMFRLGEESYRSLQLDASHRDTTTAWSILDDAPSAALERQHRENQNPLSFL
ncbi:MAG: Ig-like domain-containing protein, partial [Planctomycetota bacterium]